MLLILGMMMKMTLVQRFEGIISMQNSFADAALENPWAYRGM